MTLEETAAELVNKLDQLLMQKDHVGAEHAPLDGRHGRAPPGFHR